MVNQKDKEQDPVKSRKNKDRKKQKVRKEMSFLKTFLIFLVAFTLIITLGMSLLSGVGDIQLFGDDNPKLSLELNTLIDPDNPFYDAFTEANRVNVLLLGTNQNMADTIMLVSFDMDLKHVDVVSVPRDTYFYRKGYYDPGSHKINSVMLTDGPVGMAKAVSATLMDIPINYYAVIKYDGVKAVVDAMGGVPMDVKQDMNYKDPYDKPVPLVIDIKKGEQVLDGDHAVQFLRYRKGYREGDLGRVKAQQEFIKAAFKQALKKDFLKVAKKGIEVVDSDLDIKTVVALATKALGMESDDMTTYMMPNTPYDRAPWYVIADGPGIEEMITEMYSLQPEVEETTDGAIEQ